MKVVSDVSRDIGQVLFASVVIGPLVAGNIDLFSFLMGSALSLISWYFSVALIKSQ